jgi:arylsulfatase A-like enzyme
MLFRLPDQLSASVNDDLVMNMDLFPTILDAVGSADDTLHGRSLRSSLPGADPTSGPLRDALYLEFHGIRYLRTERALVRRDGMKYIFNPADQDELYDLNADPHELHNLLTTDPDSVTAASMRRDLCEAARVYGDPVYPTISKWFGEWNTGVNQPDAASAYASNLEVDEG